MTISFTEDIHSITELKRHTKSIFKQVHRTGRPIVLTVNGKADAVLVDVKTYESQMKAMNMALLLDQAEDDLILQKKRPVRQFLKEFKHAHKISR